MFDFFRNNTKELLEMIYKNEPRWPTAFAKHDMLSIQPLVERYGQYEWKVKPADKRTVGRFHIHILSGKER